MDFFARIRHVCSHGFCGGDSVEDGELQCGACADFDHRVYLLACDTNGRRKGGGGAGRLGRNKQPEHLMMVDSGAILHSLGDHRLRDSLKRSNAVAGDQIIT
ncbi:hypothetical protein SDC9_151576 [bioreactor metagenome]|uniref:Uncharacterized protein n=1 Tax=bioreactor metagenome TaxID=1076179 RepID=A0A645ET13_9ZZZZ